MSRPAAVSGARRWGEMRWPEFEELDRERTMVLIPFGSIEQHGPHLRLDEGIQNALMLSALVSAASPRKVLVSSLSYWSLVPDVLAEVGTSDFGGMGHADEMETSMALHLRPGSVAATLPAADLPTYGGRHDAIDLRGPGPVLTPLDTARDTWDGIIGDPSVATREKGEAIVDAIVSPLVEVIDDLCERPLAHRSGS